MKTFVKRIENFVCTHCGAEVLGNGYTNHCPKCLWSKHVDNNPGDRSSECKGMMEPVSVIQKNNNFIITHKCTKCGKTINQHCSENDDINEIIKLSTQNNFIFGKK